MKNKLLLGFAITLLSYTLVGCKKDATESGDAVAVKNNFPVALNISFNVAIMVREAMIENNCQLFTCPNIITINDYGNYKKLVFNFGTGCTGTDGVIRKGIIEDSIVPVSGNSGYMHHVYFSDYHENDVKVVSGFFQGGQMDNMFSTRRFYSYFDQTSINSYTLLNNGGFSSKLPDLYIQKGSDKGFYFVFSGILGLANLGATGYGDDSYTWSGNASVHKDYTVISDTYVKNSPMDESYGFTGQVASQFHFSCGGAKKIKGGSYTFDVIQQPGGVNPGHNTSDFSFSNDCN